MRVGKRLAKMLSSTQEDAAMSCEEAFDYQYELSEISPLAMLKMIFHLSVSRLHVEVVSNLEAVDINRPTPLKGLVYDPLYTDSKLASRPCFNAGGKVTQSTT